LRGLALNFARTHQTEKLRGFSEVGENKQLLIAIAGSRYYFDSLKLKEVYIFLRIALALFSMSH
jgi:hypothetical protein